MTLTTDHPDDKEPECIPPANTHNRSEQPPSLLRVNHHHHHEEPPFSPLPPPFHEFRSYKEIVVYLTHLLLRLNHRNASCPCCDDEFTLPPTPNANYHHNEQPPDTFDSDMAEYQRRTPPPQPESSGYHSLHIPPIIHPHNNHQNPTNYLDNKPTFRVYTKAKTDYSLAIRDGKVILAPINPSDLHQHWIKDEKFGSGIKDERGSPAFAMVNKATGQALKYSIGVTYPVQLTSYNPNEVDLSVLWSQGVDLGDSYRSFRTVTNIHLNLDAHKGLKQYGGVRDGTEIVLWEWTKGDNQRWVIFPYCKSFCTKFTQYYSSVVINLFGKRHIEENVVKIRQNGFVTGF